MSVVNKINGKELKIGDSRGISSGNSSAESGVNDEDESRRIKRAMNKGTITWKITAETTREKDMGRYVPRMKRCSKYSQRRL